MFKQKFDLDIIAERADMLFVLGWNSVLYHELDPKGENPEHLYCIQNKKLIWAFNFKLKLIETLLTLPVNKDLTLWKIWLFKSIWNFKYSFRIKLQQNWLKNIWMQVMEKQMNCGEKNPFKYQTSDIWEHLTQKYNGKEEKISLSDMEKIKNG